MDNEFEQICTPGIEHQTPNHCQWWNNWIADSAAQYLNEGEIYKIGILWLIWPIFIMQFQLENCVA